MCGCTTSVCRCVSTQGERGEPGIQGAMGDITAAAADLFVPYTGATGNVDLNNVQLYNVDKLGVGNSAPVYNVDVTGTIGATTSVTTPLVIGGTAVGSSVTYQSTTGIGTTTGVAHNFTGGTNGATSLMNMLNDGSVGIGATATSDTVLTIGKAITGGATAYGEYFSTEIQSDVTSNSTIHTSAPTTEDAAFTLSNLTHYRVNDVQPGAASTVTNQYGFRVGTMSGATNNVAFASAVVAGVGQWNIYASGTAINYFAGNIGIGSSNFGTNATCTLGISSNVAPTTSPADLFQLYSLDITAGNAAPHFRTEAGNIVKLFTGAALTTALTTVTFTAPGTPDYAMQTVQLAGYGFATEDEGNTALKVIANLQVRVNELEARMQANGLVA